MNLRPYARGFTLIELLIVIAIILILIAISLPNFLEAQARAKLTRARADMRGLGTAIESFRTERGVLLIDFWDDDTFEAHTRWLEKLGRVGRDPIREYDFFEECFYPLTTPVAYIQEVPIDLWADRSRDVGLGSDEQGFSYLYFDNDVLRGQPEENDHGIDAFALGSAENFLLGIKPLAIEEFGLLSVGPDRILGQTGPVRFRGMPYAPTNGTNSYGELVFRSGGFTFP
jgi:prepilin-type N-terminal cleavage/methylation domain-containing protein